MTIIKNAGLGNSDHLLDLLKLHHESINMPDISAAIADQMNKASNWCLSPSSNQRNSIQLQSQTITARPVCVESITVCMHKCLFD